MKRYTLCLLLSLVALTASAQDAGLHYQHAKYCMSFADYQADWWTDVDNVAKVTRSFGKVKWSGGTAIRFESTDKELSKLLKSQAFALMMNDTLYVNLRNMKHAGAKWGSGYALAYPFDHNKQLLFLERYVSTGQNMKVALGTFTAGIIGGFAMANTINWKGKECFLIESDNPETTYIGSEKMQELLKDKPDLLKRYSAFQTKKEQRDAYNIMPLLIEARLVSKSASLHKPQEKK